MVTKEQAVNPEVREFHEEGCKRIVGKRGGVTLALVHWRRNGKTKTWKTRPTHFSVPVKYGLYGYGYITHDNAHEFHVAADCPLDKER
jgi:hypothetical protein